MSEGAIWTTTDGKVQFQRNEDGDVLIITRGPAPDHVVVSTRRVPAQEWAFIARVV